MPVTMRTLMNLIGMGALVTGTWASTLTEDGLEPGHGYRSTSTGCAPCDPSRALTYRGNGADNLGYDWSPKAWGGPAFPNKQQLQSSRGGWGDRDGRMMPMPDSTPKSDYACPQCTHDGQNAESMATVTSPVLGVRLRNDKRLPVEWTGRSMRWDGFRNGMSWDHMERRDDSELRHWENTSQGPSWDRDGKGNYASKWSYDGSSGANAGAEGNAWITAKPSFDRNMYNQNAGSNQGFVSYYPSSSGGSTRPPYRPSPTSNGPYYVYPQNYQTSTSRPYPSRPSSSSQYGAGDISWSAQPEVYIHRPTPTSVPVPHGAFNRPGSGSERPGGYGSLSTAIWNGRPNSQGYYTGFITEISNPSPQHSGSLPETYPGNENRPDYGFTSSERPFGYGNQLELYKRPFNANNGGNYLTNPEQSNHPNYRPRPQGNQGQGYPGLANGRYPSIPPGTNPDKHFGHGSGGNLNRYPSNGGDGVHDRYPSYEENQNKNRYPIIVADRNRDRYPNYGANRHPDRAPSYEGDRNKYQYPNYKGYQNRYPSYEDRYPGYGGDNNQDRYSSYEGDTYLGHGGIGNPGRFPSYENDGNQDKYDNKYNKYPSHGNEPSQNSPYFQGNQAHIYYGNDNSANYRPPDRFNGQPPLTSDALNNNNINRPHSRPNSGDYDRGPSPTSESANWNYGENDGKDPSYRRSGGSYPLYKGGQYFTSSFLASASTPPAVKQTILGETTETPTEN